jgi:hypothetical protein
MISLGRSTGLVIDIGYTQCSVVPVFDYQPLFAYHTTAQNGMQYVIESIKQAILDYIPDKSNVDIPDHVLEQIQCGFLSGVLNPETSSGYFTVRIPGIETLSLPLEIGSGVLSELFDPSEMGKSLSLAILNCLAKVA